MLKFLYSACGYYSNRSIGRYKAYSIVTEGIKDVEL